jgi:membrane-associated phospholipid phosphatase
MAVERRVWELGIGVAAFAGSWAIAREAARVPAWEENISFRINAWPDWLAVPLWPVMQLGNFWMVVAVPAGLWFVTKRKPPVAAAALATGSAWALAKVIKEQVGRGRPADFFANIDVRETGVNGLGFVSGHAAVAFAAATVVAVYMPRRWIPLPFALAALTGLSRVYYGAHLPLDVVGGAGLGLACGALALLVTGEPRTSTVVNPAEGTGTTQTIRSEPENPA